MSARRVLVVSEPMEYGVLSYLEHLFAGIDRTRWEPALAYSPHRMAPQARRLLADLERANVRLCPLPFRRSAGLSDASAALALLNEIRAFQPEVLHLHSSKAGLAGRISAWVHGVPIAYTPHGTSWHYTRAPIRHAQRLVERLMRSATTALLCGCEAESQAFQTEIGFRPERVRIVPNGVPVPSRQRLVERQRIERVRHGLGEGEVWALFVGRLTKEKGLDVLLDALATVPQVRGLLVVGEGRDRADLEGRAASLGDRVRFCGYHEDVSAYLAAADIFVVPSRSEGLPFTVLEAMAHGLPLLCSAVGGIPTTVGDSGRLVAPADGAALAAALGDLASDPHARRHMGDAARRRVESRFSLSIMLDGIHDAYDALVGVAVPSPEASRCSA